MRKIALLTLLLAGSAIQQRTVVFSSPIDALSVRLPSETAQISVHTHEGWHTFVVENEQDPSLLESDLVMFPEHVDRVVLRGNSTEAVLHPIVVSTEPATYSLAATTFYRAPRILRRSDWGADDQYLYKAPELEPSVVPTVTQSSSASSTSSNREEDCAEAQQHYPDDFVTTKTITHDSNGKRLRWARRYSPEIDMLVVHHTALKVSGDSRPPVERMRALYEYHANNRGWGDIGYHYIIDEQGGIYEGRSGGDFVVGGHAYCANVKTLGIALMGNFELEQPTLQQIQSLQWLLQNLAEKYDINLNRNVSYKGKNLKPIIRHKDLVSTECPGYYVANTIAQIRNNVIAGTIDAGVKFPTIAKSSREDRVQQRLTARLEEAGQALSRTFYRAKRLTRTAERQNNSRLQFYREQRAVSSNVQRRRSATQQQPMRPTGTLYRPSTTQLSSTDNAPDGHIRIRLSYTGNVATITGDTIGTVRLGIENGSCIATPTGTANPRIGNDGDVLTVSSWNTQWNRFRGIIECQAIDGELILINELPLEDYMAGLSEQPDTEPREKQKAFAVAARSYAAFYMEPGNEKFPGKPYDGSDSGASFQSYSGVAFEERNPRWVQSVRDTAGRLLMKDGGIVKAAYYSSNDGRTRSPSENGWRNFPYAEIFASKPDPWCEGMTLRGHGVGMSGCGAEGQANQGKSYADILEYYYPGTTIATR